MHALAEVGHEVAERAPLPALVQGVEALRDAVGGRRDLVGVDGIELPPRGLGVPEDQRAPTDQTSPALAGGEVGWARSRKGVRRPSGLQTGRLDGVHALGMLLPASEPWQRGGAGPRG
ncbi:MAG: hypothetical protein AUI36_38110 [Cyanobacteria bacterium 13_1_40CM_2_61_4]|nr:MAG: hypothetical protein AUI36_38110 [Cyanobacteria bacterium 13_1_40CM_2_61_4]